MTRRYSSDMQRSGYRTTLKIVASAEFSNGPASSGSRSPSFVVLTSLAVKSGTNNTRRVFARIEYVTAWGNTPKSSTRCKTRTQVNNYFPSLSLLGETLRRRAQREASRRPGKMLGQSSNWAVKKGSADVNFKHDYQSAWNVLGEQRIC